MKIKSFKVLKVIKIKYNDCDKTLINNNSNNTGKRTLKQEFFIVEKSALKGMIKNEWKINVKWMTDEWGDEIKN